MNIYISNLSYAVNPHSCSKGLPAQNPASTVSVNRQRKDKENLQNKNTGSSLSKYG